jgi:urease accessory protein
MISPLIEAFQAIRPLAHPVPGDPGLLAGLAHPVGGIDHMLAMVSIGIVSARRGRTWIMLVPALFVLGMIVGGVLGYQHLNVPYAEPGIAASVLLVGLATLLDRDIPASVVALPVAAFGVFHGFAHGAQMPAETSAMPFTFGFITTTIGLHVMGALLGMISNELVHGRRVTTVIGSGVALTGLFFLIPAV